ncbi:MULTISPECIES: MerR family transcriptional regulator [unclassified Streptomyces]|uniref:MerR family transcriptional regulator n=1 Tax=Streptomyces sp. NPDC055082 TaxID=3365718 RepID=UPI0037D3CC61
MVSIGEFARLSRLSAKVLRRYDELGLLRPALVDPVNGYRYYDRAQVETARLVAWLRRIGMPLTRISGVVALDAGAAAAEIRAYWARVEAETAARRDLATFLVDHLSGEDITMSKVPNDARGGQESGPGDGLRDSNGRPGGAGSWAGSGSGGGGGSRGQGGSGGGAGAGLGTLGIRYAALSDTGTVRESNQDAVHAGARLLAVADGFGASGAEASAAAIGALRPAAQAAVSAAHLLNALEDAADLASRAVRDAVAGRAVPEESGTTLTAMVWTGSGLGLVHIGDSRAYLLRGGELFRITHDHSLVQSMIDDGSLTAEEARSHPQRALLLKALVGGASTTPHRPDVRLYEARPGDRYLLCSDGLSAVVDEADLTRALFAADGPDTAVHELVALAVDAGGPDNVACVVADVVAL